MDQPVVYSEANHNQKLKIKIFMEKHMKLLKFDEDCRILDVGSGDGSVTKMFKAFVGKVEILLGIDVSEKMVEFAKSRNFDENVEFAVGNVEVAEGFAKLFGVFDYVFSSFCFHWVRNQTQAWRNVYDVLKPGGKVFTVFICESQFYDIYGILAKKPKWVSYMENYKNYFAPYLYLENPGKAVEECLRNVGFVVEVCDTLDETNVFANQEHFKKFINAIDPFTPKMSKDLVQDYLDDFLQVFNKLQDINLNSNTNDGTVNLTFQIFHVVAAKPIH